MKQAILDRVGIDGGRYVQTVDTAPSAVLMTDSQGEVTAECNPVVEDFRLLPVITTVAATSAKLVLLAGTNALSAHATKSVSGGVNLVTAGADDDQTYVKGIANTGFDLSIRPASLGIFRARVNLTDFTAVMHNFGLNENPTDPDPSATAGEGASFLAIPYAVVGDLTVDPTVGANGGLVEANFANWIIHEKVNGADKFYATTVPVQTGVDIGLCIKMGADFKCNYYINGQLVRTGDTALTENDKVYVFGGLQALGAAAKAQIIRYISLSRNFG